MNVRISLLLLTVSLSAFAAVHRRIDSTAQLFCGRIESESLRSRCLDEAGKKPAKKYDSVALSVCNKLDESEQPKCLVVAREARRFDSEALLLCARVVQPGELIECLSTVADRWFRPSSLRLCERAANGREAIRCLAELRE